MGVCLDLVRMQEVGGDCSQLLKTKHDPGHQRRQESRERLTWTRFYSLAGAVVQPPVPSQAVSPTPCLTGAATAWVSGVFLPMLPDPGRGWKVPQCKQLSRDEKPPGTSEIGHG